MAKLDSEHLLEQAERLLARLPQGPHRQVDLRRAISSAYYGVFHFTMASISDEIVGASFEGSSAYRLAYRSVDHSSLRVICNDLSKKVPPQKYLAYLPAGEFCGAIREFAIATRDLMQKRHLADYDPGPNFRVADARVAIELGRQAMLSFHQASSSERKLFLTLLVCPPRG